MVYYLRSLCLVTVVTTATPTDRIRMVRWQDIQVHRFYLWKWKCEKFLLRKLKCDYYLLLQSGEAHQVTQFHIMNWEPDGRCSNPKTITDVIEEVIMVQMRTGNHPIVVHCRWCSIRFLHIHTHPFLICYNCQRMYTTPKSYSTTCKLLLAMQLTSENYMLRWRLLH